MLPVGMRNASMTNALKTNANMKAVISHSNVLAISTALSFFFSAGLPESALSLLSEEDINPNPVFQVNAAPLVPEQTQGE
jgi:hypothetical protein